MPEWIVWALIAGAFGGIFAIERHVRLQSLLMQEVLYQLKLANYRSGALDRPEIADE